MPAIIVRFSIPNTPVTKHNAIANEIVGKTSRLAKSEISDNDPKKYNRIGVHTMLAAIVSSSVAPIIPGLRSP